mmetsp:Transcript_1946/g.5492  ORF Transcript_1946/g.5492 Transcript_1946/m.5492 type:complete len:513 (-) Transcript_1946:153-1691(-)
MSDSLLVQDHAQDHLHVAADPEVCTPAADLESRPSVVPLSREALHEDEEDSVSSDVETLPEDETPRVNGTSWWDERRARAQALATKKAEENRFRKENRASQQAQTRERRAQIKAERQAKRQAKRLALKEARQALQEKKAGRALPADEASEVEEPEQQMVVWAAEPLHCIRTFSGASDEEPKVEDQIRHTQSEPEVGLVRRKGIVLRRSNAVGSFENDGREEVEIPLSRVERRQLRIQVARERRKSLQQAKAERLAASLVASGDTGPQRTVFIGKRVLVALFATHWAVKVGETWYEIHGASKNATGLPNAIRMSEGEASAGFAVTWTGDIVGTTRKSDEAIKNFIWGEGGWIAKNPWYNFTTTNCQKFATDFAFWLTSGRCLLPPMEAGVGVLSRGPSAFVAKFAGASKVAVMTGHLERTNKLARISADGPMATAQAGLRRHGFGAFGEMSLGHVEGSLGGGVCSVLLDVNVNTGIGWRNGNAELTVLGFGARVGQNGVRLNTPVLGLSCSVM